MNVLTDKCSITFSLNHCKLIIIIIIIIIIWIIIIIITRESKTNRKNKTFELIFKTAARLHLAIYHSLFSTRVTYKAPYHTIDYQLLPT